MNYFWRKEKIAKSGDMKSCLKRAKIFGKFAVNRKFTISRINRKALLIYYPTIVIMALTMLIVGFFFINGKTASMRIIGEKQFELFHAYQQGEKALLFLDSSAKLVTSQAAYDLGREGGFGKPSKCGDYLGINYWSDGRNFCLPNAKEEYKRVYHADLSKILYTYSNPMIPIDNYHYSYDDQGNMIGIAESSIVVPVGKPTFAGSYYSGGGLMPVYVPPKDSQALMEGIKSNYDLIILQLLKELPDDTKVSTSLIAGLVAQESKGDPNAISPTGCVGLGQACYCTALAYSSMSNSCDGYTKQSVQIFDKLQTCNCAGTKPNRVCQCNPGNDDRFDAIKSLRLSTHLMHDNIMHFVKKKHNDYAVEFALAAYNGGSDVIDKAIAKTGKENPTWAEVAAAIEPSMITYFKSPSDKQKKVNEIIGYVSKVMGYKLKYEQVAYPASVAPESPALPDYIGESRASELIGQHGKYEISPSFRVKVDYDFSPYEAAKQATEYIALQCKDGEIAASCMEEKIAEINQLSSDLRWSLGSCGSDEETLFYDFAERINDCRDSRMENCTCDIKLPRRKVAQSGQDYILMKNAGDNLNIIYAKSSSPKEEEIKLQNMIHDAQAGALKFDTSNNNVILTKNADLALRISYDSSDPGRIEKVDVLSVETNSQRWTYDYPTSIFFRKLGKNMSVVYPNEINNAALGRSCEPDRRLRLCIETKASLKAFDEIEDKIDTRQVRIRLALNISDDMPPAKVKGITGEDVAKAENAVLVKWLLNDEKDVFRYRIYYSTEPFAGLDDSNVHLWGEAEKDESEKIMGDFNGYDNSKENNDIYIVVTAVDNNGNEAGRSVDNRITSSDVIVVKETDDARPAIDSEVVANYDGANVQLRWTIPSLNDDGSEVKDVTGYNIYDGDTFLFWKSKEEAHGIGDNAFADVSALSAGIHVLKVEATDEAYKSAEPPLKKESNEIIVP